MRRIFKKTAICLFAAVLLVFTFLTGPAAAHFLLNLNVRIIHVEHLNDGLRVYIRLPTPYLVANLVGPVQANGLPAPAPYTTITRENGRLMYYLNVGALRADPEGLGRLVADGHNFVSDGKILQAEVEQVKVYPGTEQPPFSTIEEARASMQGELYPESFPVAYVGDTVVDVVLRYSNTGPTPIYTVSSTLDPGLPGQEKTANLILDYYPGSVEVFRVRGLLEQPIEISRSRLAAAITFIKEGVQHILDGFDHVLFVICLALGAVSLSSLFWRTTGFTIGHSVTLSLGFFGFVPSGDWFIPSVELGIAISIIFAAVYALRQGRTHSPPELLMFAITISIGLLHGLGFSFMVKEILQVDSPNIWQSLLAFNMGVEIGQVVIILLSWPIFRLIARLNFSYWILVRGGVAGVAIAVASFWTVQRVMLLGPTLY